MAFSKEKLLEGLTCSCKEMMTPPIYLCEKGHSVCSNCYTQVTCCSICRSPLLGVESCNFALEMIYTDSDLPCKNVDFKCPQIVLGEKMKEHEERCDYGPCPAVQQSKKRCPWKGLLSNFENHVKERHTYQTFSHAFASTVFLESEKHSRDLCRFVFAHGRVFQYRTKVTANTYKFCFAYIGSKHEASNYLTCFKIIEKASGKYTLSMAACQYYNVDDEQCFDDDFMCATFTKEQIKAIRQDPKKLEYKCNVLKKETFDSSLNAL